MIAGALARHGMPNIALTSERAWLRLASLLRTHLYSCPTKRPLGGSRASKQGGSDVVAMDACASDVIVIVIDCSLLLVSWPYRFPTVVAAPVSVEELHPMGYSVRGTTQNGPDR